MEKKMIVHLDNRRLKEKVYDNRYQTANGYE